MTVLIGASVLLIAGSAVALVFGWTGADQSLIWTSIAATAAAAVTLALAYFRSRSSPAPSQGPSTATQAPEGIGPGTEGAGDTTPRGAVPEPVEEPEKEEAPAEPPPTQEVPAATPARAKPTVRRLEVVAIASTKKFHRPDCRYASSSGAEKMTKSEARKKGFAPCGVCKP